MLFNEFRRLKGLTHQPTVSHQVVGERYSPQSSRCVPLLLASQVASLADGFLANSAC